MDIQSSDTVMFMFSADSLKRLMLITVVWLLNTIIVVNRIEKKIMYFIVHFFIVSYFLTPQVNVLHKLLRLEDYFYFCYCHYKWC